MVRNQAGATEKFTTDTADLIYGDSLIAERWVTVGRKDVGATPVPRTSEGFNGSLPYDKMEAHGTVGRVINAFQAIAWLADSEILSP